MDRRQSGIGRALGRLELCRLVQQAIRVQSASAWVGPLHPHRQGCDTGGLGAVGRVSRRGVEDRSWWERKAGIQSGTVQYSLVGWQGLGVPFKGYPRRVDYDGLNWGSKGWKVLDGSIAASAVTGGGAPTHPA